MLKVKGWSSNSSIIIININSQNSLWGGINTNEEIKLFYTPSKFEWVRLGMCECVCEKYYDKPQYVDYVAMANVDPFNTYICCDGFRIMSSRTHPNKHQWLIDGIFLLKLTHTQSCKQSTFNFLFIAQTFQSRFYYSSNFVCVSCVCVCVCI